MDDKLYGASIVIASIIATCMIFLVGYTNGRVHLSEDIRTCVTANSGEMDHAYNVCFQTYAPPNDIKE